MKLKALGAAVIVQAAVLSMQVNAATPPIPVYPTSKAPSILQAAKASAVKPALKPVSALPGDASKNIVQPKPGLLKPVSALPKAAPIKPVTSKTAGKKPMPVSAMPKAAPVKTGKAPRAK